MNKISVLIQIITLPFTEFELYKKDFINELSKNKEQNQYNKILKDFKEKIYLSLNRTQHIEGLDDINLLIAKYYPKHILNEFSNISDFYIHRLKTLTKCFITQRNGEIAIKYWEGSSEEEFLGPYKGLNKILMWNSLNRMLTTDLLVVQYLLDNNMDDERYLDGYYFNVMLEDLQLHQVLCNGVAETHIHKNAGTNFYITWQSIMNLNQKKIKNDMYKNEFYFDSLLGGINNLQNYVMGMAVVRLLMGYYLQYQKEYKTFLIFIKSVNKYHEEKDDRLLNMLYRISDGKQLEDDNFYEIWDFIKENLNLVEKGVINKNEYINKDILNLIFKCQQINTLSENILLIKALKYINDSQEDVFFSRLFWKYIIIKNKAFQLKVQNNKIKGLLNFQNYFKRSTFEKKYYDKKNYEYWKIILSTQFQNPYLKKLELRVSFNEGKTINNIKKNIKKMLIEFFKSYKEVLKKRRYKDYDIVPKVGLVFHFIKQKDPSEEDKCWYNYYNHKTVEELYYRKNQEKYMNQIKALNQIREEIEGISNYIIGIDAASIENDTEPWVFAPVYKLARDSSKKLVCKNFSKRIKNLGFTFHVGEDFRHLLTGLRNIDEVIEHFRFHSGDRIGHGIALGIGIDKWAKQNNVIILPRVEYLENLLWLWGINKDGKYDIDLDTNYLEQKIIGCAEKIYLKMDGIDVYTLWKVYQNKFTRFDVDKRFVEKFINSSDKKVYAEILCKQANADRTISWNEENLQYVQHCKCYLERMVEPIIIGISLIDINMMKKAQKILANKVSTLGIIVETNPTSNTVIGQLDDIYNHYIINLNKKGLEKNAEIENSIMVSINSDDPSVFNTNISNEFAFIFYSLQEKGYSREDILAWIDKVRQFGMDSSFIDNRELSYDKIIGEIDNLLENLNDKI